VTTRLRERAWRISASEAGMCERSESNVGCCARTAVSEREARWVHHVQMTAPSRLLPHHR
jgi:hypothetical protein